MIAGNLIPTTPKQWLKLALIPTLSVVLLMLLWQKPKSPDDMADDTAIAPVLTQAPASPPIASQPQLRKPIWPKARLEDIVAFNPFERQEPDESEDEAALSSDGRPAAGRHAGKSRSRLVTAKLQAIFVDAQGAAAILDSQVIHVGDTLPGGGRVAEITPEGIKLEGS